jgi:hypothetical protein
VSGVTGAQGAAKAQGRSSVSSTCARREGVWNCGGIVAGLII